MHTVDKDTICAVIVTFHPSPEELACEIRAIARQVGSVLLVDNTPSGGSQAVADFADVLVQKLILGENRGIAAAQNLGIAWAAQNGFSHVLLLDQDSVPAEDMVARLYSVLLHLRASGEKVAAVGPGLHDTRGGDLVHFVVRRQRFPQRYFCAGREIVAVPHLIASGSLIPLDSLKEIGPFEDDLFIEYVDIEWGFRAHRQGYYCHGVCGAVLSHSMGDRIITSPLLFGRRFQVYAPFRFYYQFRNAISLCKRSYIPISVRIHILTVHVLCRFIISMAVLPSRIQILKMMSKGVLHGLAGKAGPL